MSVSSIDSLAIIEEIEWDFQSTSFRKQVKKKRNILIVKQNHTKKIKQFELKCWYYLSTIGCLSVVCLIGIINFNKDFGIVISKINETDKGKRKKKVD